jgi:MFS family permease
MKRWWVLFLCSTILVGNYYAFDIPAAINHPLEAYLKLSSFQYALQLFYSLYSIPNTILPFFGGAMIDRYGAAVMLPILSGFIVLGQFLFSLGIQYKQVWMMFFGRLVFGIGGESLQVVV